MTKYISSRERISKVIKSHIIGAFHKDPHLEIDYNKTITELALHTGSPKHLILEVLNMHLENGDFLELRKFVLSPEKIKEIGDKKIETAKAVKEDFEEVGI